MFLPLKIKSFHMTEEHWSCWVGWRSMTKKDHETRVPLGESASSRGRGFWLHYLEELPSTGWTGGVWWRCVSAATPQQLSTWQPPTSSRSLAWQSGRYKSPRSGTAVRPACLDKEAQVSEIPLSQLAHCPGSVQSMTVSVSEWVLPMTPALSSPML